jgi:DnaJ-class molecular chaperone
MSDFVDGLKTDPDGYTICPACNGNKWKAVKTPRLGPGVYETRCDKCNGYGWIEHEHETRP